MNGRRSIRPSSLGGELALIERIRHRAHRETPRTPALCLGIGDDAAILRMKAGEELVVTTDFSLETRHFTRDRHPARSAGWRTLARGLSDIAAMGARPLAAFLSLALPHDTDPAWVDGFLDGLLALARETRTPLAGGDTSQAPGEHILADIVLLGAVPQRRALRRDRAHAGDALYMTGALGGAAAELNDVLHRRPVADGPHLFPQPRLRTGQALVRRGLASAAMDISDGLSTDLAHLCTASGLRAEIDAEALPIHPLAAQRDDALHLALHGGEDYELLFAAPAATRIPAKLAGVPITRIGKLHRKAARQPQLLLISADGRRSPLKPQGWEHLR